MKRRKFLIGAGGMAAGGSALLGSGALSRVESQRSVTVQVAEDPNAYLGLKPLDTPNSINYVELDEQGHLEIDIGEHDDFEADPDGAAPGEGVNSDSRTWFDGMFEICNQGKEDACVSYTAPDDLGRDEAELIFYYDGETDNDPSTSGRIDIEEGEQLPLPLGECVEIGVRTETFGVDATVDEPLFDGEVTVIADVDGDCFATGDPGPDAFSISASPDAAGETDSIHRVEVPVEPELDGATLSSLTVDYPDDFDVGGVGPDDVLGAGVQRTDSSITPLSVSDVTISSIEFSLSGSVSVSTGDTIFIEYQDVTNPSTPGDYTIVVDVNGSEIGPGTLTVTSASDTPQPVTSTFDTGDEGWEIIGDAQGDSAVPNYEASIGNPAPSIGAVDDVLGGTWYFKAPGKFLADKSDFYRGTLEFDLRQDPDGNFQFDNDDIILEGAGMELNYDHGDTSTHPPDGSFGSYSITLDESDDWTKDGSPATESEIQSVLGDLTGLFVRGEYESGADEGYLDNVSMNPP